MSRGLPITDVAGIPRPSMTARSRPSMFGMLKDLETKVSRVSVMIRGAGISPLISSPMLRVSSPPSLSPSLMEQSQKEEDEDKRDYYLNMGYAIRTIREELPEIFYRAPNFDIYMDDIIFKDPLNTFVGIDNYKLIFGALRFCGQLFFKVLWVDIVSIWQPIENIIMIRWTVHGIPRVPWESHGRFDGTSEYKLDRNGKIFEHKVHNVAINSPPKFRVLAVEEMIQSLGCPSTAKPTFFETTSCLFLCSNLAEKLTGKIRPCSLSYSFLPMHRQRMTCLRRHLPKQILSMLQNPYSDPSTIIMAVHLFV